MAIRTIILSEESWNNAKNLSRYDTDKITNIRVGERYIFRTVRLKMFVGIIRSITPNRTNFTIVVEVQ